MLEAFWPPQGKLPKDRCYPRRQRLEEHKALITLSSCKLTLLNQTYLEIHVISEHVCMRPVNLLCGTARGREIFFSGKTDSIYVGKWLPAEMRVWFQEANSLCSPEVQFSYQ